MTIKEFIEKAIEGGWNKDYTIIHFGDGGDVMLRHKNEVDRLALITAEILLDPKAWEAVGKVEGWGTYKKGCKDATQGIMVIGEVSLLKMHQMIDALWSGKSLEQFIKTF